MWFEKGKNLKLTVADSELAVMKGKVRRAELGLLGSQSPNLPQQQQQQQQIGRSQETDGTFILQLRPLHV